MTDFKDGETLFAADLNTAFAAVAPPDASLLGANSGTFASISVSSSFTIVAGTLDLAGASSGVTSVAASGGSTGLTFSGSPITTSGTLALAGTLGVAAGGTGLGAVGNSGGVLAYVGTGTLASSAILAANHVVVGGGVGLTPATIGGLGSANQMLLSQGVGNPPVFGNLTLSDGTNSVAPLTKISVVGATVSGSTPNGTITVSGGGSGLVLTDGTATVSPTGTLTVIGGTVSGTTPGGTITVSGAGTIAASSLFGNAATAAAIPGAITVGPGLNLATNGTLSATGTAGVGTLTAGSNIAITNPTGPNATVALGTIAASSLFGNVGTAAGTLGAVAVGLGLSLNAGSLSAHQQITVAATAAGTFAITPSLGATSVLVNGPAAGGAVVLTMGSMAVDQTLKIIIRQGATAATWTLGSGFSFGATVPSYTATAVANQFDVIVALSNLGTVGDVMAIDQGFTA